jgi:hypothetical protein
MPWHSREFVVKDCDGRLLASGSNLGIGEQWQKTRLAGEIFWCRLAVKSAIPPPLLDLILGDYASIENVLDFSADSRSAT